MKPIIGIMAATKEGVIGSKGVLPWDYPDELEHFKNVTLNHIVVMGDKTYESTPKDLFKDRQAVVLSRNTKLHLKDAIVFYNLDEFLDYAKTYPGNSQCFMIGGGEIADLFLKNNLISSFVFTLIHKSYIGDVYLDLGYFRTWSKEELKRTENYTIYLLTNPGLRGSFRESLNRDLDNWF